MNQIEYYKFKDASSAMLLNFELRDILYTVKPRRLNLEREMESIMFLKYNHFY